MNQWKKDMALRFRSQTPNQPAPYYQKHYEKYYPSKKPTKLPSGQSKKNPHINANVNDMNVKEGGMNYEQMI